MEDQEIRKLVEKQIKLWMNLQKKRQRKVKFTEGAIDFFCLMIQNIEKDKSEYWDYQNENSNTAQEFAISLLPNILNDIHPDYRHWYRNRRTDFTISSWEIWHSMTELIDNFCFIPKKR